MTEEKCWTRSSCTNEKHLDHKYHSAIKARSHCSDNKNDTDNDANKENAFHRLDEGVRILRGAIQPIVCVLFAW